MIICLGILSVFQLTFLPGLIVTRFVKIQGVWQTILLSIALSPIINYLFVFFAVAIGIYNRLSVFIFLGIEIVLLAYLLRPSLNTTVGQLLDNLGVIPFFRDYLKNGKAGWSGVFIKILFASLFFLAIYHVLNYVFIYANQKSSMFVAWDAVVSWDRWAVDWYNNRLPNDTWHYPQLIPANWSLTYQFVGDSRIKFFAKNFMAMIEVFVLITIFILGIVKRHAGYFIAVAVTAWIQSVLGSNGNGYVDTSVAFFALSAVASLLLAQNSEKKHKAAFIYLGAILAAGAAVTKQAGLWMVICYPLLLILSVEKENRRKFLDYMPGILLIYALLITPWYGYKEYQIQMGKDNSEIQSVTSLASQGKNTMQTFESAIALLESKVKTPLLDGKSILILISVFVLLSCFSVFFAGLTGLVIIPFTLVWLFFFSYDYRNFNMVVPFIGMAAGMGAKNVVNGIFSILIDIDGVKINNAFQRFTNFLDSARRMFSSIKIVYLLVPLVGIFLLPIKYPDAYMIDKSIAKQKEIGDPGLNQKIYEYKLEHGLDGKILTDYQHLGFLPGLEQYYYLGFSTMPDDFIRKFNQFDVGYALVVVDWMSPKVASYINQLIENQKIKVIFEYYSYMFVTTCHGPCDK